MKITGLILRFRKFGIAYFLQKGVNLLFTILLLLVSKYSENFEELSIFLLLPAVLGFLTISDLGYGNYLVANKDRDQVDNIFRAGFMTSSAVTIFVLILYCSYLYDSFYMILMGILYNYAYYAYSILIGYFIKTENLRYFCYSLISQSILPIVVFVLLYLNVHFEILFFTLILIQLTALFTIIRKSFVRFHLGFNWLRQSKSLNYSIIQACTFLYTGIDIFILIETTNGDPKDVMEVFRVIGIILMVPNFVNYFDTIYSDIYKRQIIRKSILSIMIASILSLLPFFTIPIEYFAYTIFLIIASFVQIDFMILRLNKIIKLLPIFVFIAIIKAFLILKLGVLGTIIPGVIVLVLLAKPQEHTHKT